MSWGKMVFKLEPWKQKRLLTQPFVLQMKKMVENFIQRNKKRNQVGEVSV